MISRLQDHKDSQEHYRCTCQDSMETGQEKDKAAAVASTIRLEKLLPPGDIPSPPSSSAHKYKIDLKERVVRADFSKCSASR